MTRSGLQVRPAGRDDLGPVADVLGRAFQDDPVYAWLLPDTDRRRRVLGPLLGTFVRHLHRGRGRIDVAVDGGRVVGVAVWDGPGDVSPGPLRFLRALPGMVRGMGLRLPAVLRLGGALDAARPAEAHWYLTHLAADPAAGRRRGVGTALLDAMLSRCDQEGLPAYLECGPDNVAFYRRFGFVPRRTVTVDGTLDVETMQRPPRPPAPPTRA